MSSTSRRNNAGTKKAMSKGKPKMAKEDVVNIRRNSKGGVLVTESELKAAFDFFDIDSEGKITLQNLRKRLGVFYKNMPTKEYKFLMNNKSEMNLDDLRDLLIDNEVTDFDPVAEAFKAYDPNSTGSIDPEMLRHIFQGLGFGEITDEDLEILIETADVNKDGRITLEDFRDMIDEDLRIQQEAETQKRLEEEEKARKEAEEAGEEVEGQDNQKQDDDPSSP
mmetsp:Transcript_1786/g.2423  ORF Transcript_1786/g.2423 Transcript_1786/m.2423 type:complete len:222 (-) Transcript_1786:272-937(-)